MPPGESEAVALADGDELDGGDTEPTTVAVAVDDVPGRVAMRSPRNVERPPVAVMKHTSWLSGLSAVGSPSRAASARTSALVR